MAAFLNRKNLAGTVYVSASVNEEVAEGAALAKVVEVVRPDFVVIGEGTDLKLGVGQKGRASVLVEATGVQAHAANPSLGVNAVYKLLPALERLRTLEAPSDPILGDGLYELIELISTPYPSNSMVPYGCLARYDCRLVRGESPDDLVARFQAAAGDDVDVSVRVRRGTYRCYTGAKLEMEEFLPAWITPSDSPFVTAARRGVQDMVQDVDHSGEEFFAHFCTNGSYTAGVAGIPTIIYGPGATEGAHVADEFITIPDLKAATDGYAAIVEAVLGSNR
jgi:acetylornithine deacetylase/succinyl-diaminopimelate desuccinylase-like protein